MSEHQATISWTRGGAEFSYETYPRKHSWSFDGAGSLAASAAPEYLGDPDCVDPEQAFVAAVASCHMLTFLALAARKRLVVARYDDRAIGYLEKDERGKLSITRILLKPSIEFEGKTPGEAELDRLHELAHEHCFIANSVRTDIRVASSDLAS